MTKRAQNIINSTSFTPATHPAICALVEFAAQNSGIEPGNYFSGWNDVNGVRAFRDEQRSISADWKRFKVALIAADAEGVTDAAIIADAPHAFSGRLEWGPKQHTPATTGGDYNGAWNYTTGQYFPTEYRKAAATLLEYATRKARQAKPPQKRKVRTIAELKALNAANGGCWFNKGEIAFFGTRIESEIIQGKYFITSESPDGTDDNARRKFSLRSFDEAGSVETMGKFCAFDDKAEALASIPSN